MQCSKPKEKKPVMIVRVHRSPLSIDEGLSVCPLWRSGGRGRACGFRIAPSHSKELQVSVELVIEGIVSVSGLEILPVLLVEDAEVVRGQGVPAEVGHGLEVVVEGWLSEFWWRSGCENLVLTSLACRR